MQSARTAGVITGAIAALASAASAQTGPIDAITTSLDATTGAVSLETVTVTRGGIEETFDVTQLLGIEIREVATAPPPLFGPALLLGPNPGDADLAGPPAGSRAEFLEDDILNSGISNPDPSDGFVFGFDGGAMITNGVGADLILFEVGPAAGVPPINAGPDTFAVAGDPFTLRGTGDQDGFVAGFGPGFYADLGTIDADTSIFAFDLVDGDTTEVDSLAELESVPLEQAGISESGFFTIYGIAIDLSQLGYADGAQVSELELLGNPSLVFAETGAFTGPFGVDATYIAALPTFIPTPGSLALIALGGALAIGRRR